MGCRWMPAVLSLPFSTHRMSDPSKGGSANSFRFPEMCPFKKIARPIFPISKGTLPSKPYHDVPNGQPELCPWREYPPMYALYVHYAYVHDVGTRMHRTPHIHQDKRIAIRHACLHPLKMIGPLLHGQINTVHRVIYILVQVPHDSKDPKTLKCKYTVVLTSFIMC